MTERPLETTQVKALMQISDAYEKVLIGLYGLSGIRPAILPQLKVGDIDSADYAIENGKIRFTNKTPFLFVRKEYKGNKAKHTFFTILNSNTTEQLELTINSRTEPITTATPLMLKYAETDKSVYKKAKEMFAKIGFVGRPYLLRTFADRSLDKHISDEDLKEHMLGHKGKISGVYQIKALTNEAKTDYRNKYKELDAFYGEHVFGMVTKEQLTIAQKLAAYAEGLGANKDDLNKAVEQLGAGKLSFEAFEQQLKQETDKALNRRMEQNFEQLYRKMRAKDLLNPT